VLAKRGAKLLDIAEASQVPMESGCRMGMCGSDLCGSWRERKICRRCARPSGEPSNVSALVPVVGWHVCRGSRDRLSSIRARARCAVGVRRR
jgi:hypothetical protein